MNPIFLLKLKFKRIIPPGVTLITK